MLACKLVRFAAVNLIERMISPCGTPDPLKNPARNPPPPLLLYCCAPTIGPAKICPSICVGDIGEGDGRRNKRKEG